MARKLEAEINPLSKGLDTAFHTQGLAELMVIYKYLLTNQLILGDMFKNGGVARACHSSSCDAKVRGSRAGGGPHRESLSQDNKKRKERLHESSPG